MKQTLMNLLFAENVELVLIFGSVLFVDTWVVGVTRYLRNSTTHIKKAGHAQEHFSDSTHLYALEIETQRVWDYAGDGYVHRLLRNREDGKLVFLLPF